MLVMVKTFPDSIAHFRRVYYLLNIPKRIPVSMDGQVSAKSSALEHKNKESKESNNHTKIELVMY